MTIALATNTAATNTAHAADTPDEAAIKTIVESVANLADSGNFESLEKLYADEVKVDYTSLDGGEPELKSPQALMSAWASFLPGFERTRHAISNAQAKVKGEQATATADVVADHWIQGRHWQVAGSYDYALAKQDGVWKITEITFNAGKQQGDKSIDLLAQKQAAAHPAPYIEHQQSMKAVRDFLTSLEEKDMEKFANVWADDAVQDMPYSPPGMPKRVEGKAALLKHYADWPKNSGKANFTKELVFYPTQDPQTLFTEFHGVTEIKPTGRTYDQKYAGLFHVEQGKITLYREYYDPNVFSYAFGLEEGGGFHGKAN